jgi:hypothetical protein
MDFLGKHRAGGIAPAGNGVADEIKGYVVPSAHEDSSIVLAVVGNCNRVVCANRQRSTEVWLFSDCYHTCHRHQSRYVLIPSKSNHRISPAAISLRHSMRTGTSPPISRTPVTPFATNNGRIMSRPPGNQSPKAECMGTCKAKSCWAILSRGIHFDLRSARPRLRFGIAHFTQTCQKGETRAQAWR